MTNAEESQPLAALYPVGEQQPERVRSRHGHALADLTLDNLLAGTVAASDFGITAAGLRLQADVAERAGRPNLAANLRRGAELVDIPDAELFEIYELLRPRRANQAADLRAAAARLRERYQAEAIAHLLEEAAAAYARRGILE